MLLFFLLVFVFFFLFFIKGNLQVRLENWEKQSEEKEKRKQATLKVAILLGEKIKLGEVHIQEKGRIVHKKAWQKMQQLAKEKEWNQKWKQDIKEISKDERNKILQELWNKKKLPIKIRKLNLQVVVGTENVVLTSYAVAILSVLISIFLALLGKEKWTSDYQYVVKPNYQEKFFYQIYLTTTIQIRICEIIHIAWMVYRWKRSKTKEKKEAVLVG